MKIVFFGTPEYVICILDSIQKNFKTQNTSPIAAVVTQSPKPSGRDKKLAYSAVDDWAFKRNILKFYSSEEFLKAGINAELAIVASYGEILKNNILNFFPKGILNVHPSLLPKYRGASPVQATIACGDEITGVSIIKMDEKVDHGPIISQSKEEVFIDDTTDSLRNRLFEKAAEILPALINAYILNKIKLYPQDDNLAIFTKQLRKEDGFIDAKILNTMIDNSTHTSKNKAMIWNIPFMINTAFDASNKSIYNYIRAMKSWPVAWTIVKIGDEVKRLKIIEAHLENTESDELLVLDKVQLEGKNEVSWKQFTDAYRNYKLD